MGSLTEEMEFVTCNSADLELLCHQLFNELKDIIPNINIQWIPQELNELADELSKTEKKPIEYIL